MRAGHLQAYVLQVGAQIRTCEGLAEPPETVDMDEPTERQSEMLYHVLVQLLKGKARKKAMAGEVANGFKVWHELKKSYESVVPGRHQMMLMALVRPNWMEIQSRDFESSLIDWEFSTFRDEQQSGQNRRRRQQDRDGAHVGA